MKFLIPIVSFVLALTFALLGHAGKEVHGGGAVICRDSTNVITLSGLLDLWVGTLPKPMGLGLNIKVDRWLVDFNYRAPEADEATIQANYEQYSLDRLFQLNPFFHDRVLANLRYLRTRVFFLPENVKLTFPDDSGNYFLPAGCQLEWAAAFYERTATNPEILYIDSEIWKNFSPAHRAALMIHEAVYMTERQSANDKLSRRSRKVVAGLFSDLTMEKLNLGAPANAEICLHRAESDRATIYWRWLSPGFVTRQFAMINGHYVLSRKSFVASDPGEPAPVQTKTVSLFEGDDDVIVSKDPTDGHLQFQLGPVTDYGQFELHVDESDTYLRESCGSPERNNQLYFKTIEILTQGSGR